MNSDPQIQSGTPSQRRAAVRALLHQPLHATSSGLSDRGRKRHSNEDRFLIAPLSETGAGAQGYLFAVADGVGGAHGGERAAELAVESIEQVSLPLLRLLCAEHAPSSARVREELSALVHRADARLAEDAAQHPALKGMATTLTVATSIGGRLFLAHVGDSRCYLMRGGRLHQMTTDQTVAQQLVRMGYLEPDAVPEHPFKNVLTDFVGGGADRLHVETHETPLRAGDVILLCTDGLTGMVREPDIAALILSARSPERACERLVARANEMGGRDNVTVVVARFDQLS
jgi:protein phosphatase